MRKRTKIVGFAGFFVLSTIAYELLWGKPFPFSPMILGFTCKELSHVVVCSEVGNPYSALEWTDGLVAGVEKFHELKLKSKPKLFAFAKDETYARRSLSKARVCAFYNGSIVISPRIQQEDSKGLLSLKVYLVHELSHSLLFQNMSLDRYIVADLDRRYDRNAFLAYLKRLLTEGHHDVAFCESFGQDFNEYLDGFRRQHHGSA